MFLALRDLRFARGRFALMGAVVALIAVLGVLLSDWLPAWQTPVYPVCAPFP